MIKDFLRSLLPTGLRRFYRNLKLVFTADMEFVLKRLEYDEKNLQGFMHFILPRAYPFLLAPPTTVHEINKHEAKFYSQNGEDGILAFIFSAIGVTDRRVVEFGGSDARENNSTNLIANFGWSGLLLEADMRTYHKAVAFYRQLLPGAANKRVTIIPQAVTAENINHLLEKNKFINEIDLLSIDIDGNDYWVWRAITAINPRVVVIEYNASLGPTAAITIPYDPQFTRFTIDPTGMYHGTSLAALEKLGAKKNYTLVGCDKSGVNAFFVRHDLMNEKITPLTAAAAYFPQNHRAHFSLESQWDKLKNLPWTQV